MMRRRLLLSALFLGSLTGCVSLSETEIPVVLGRWTGKFSVVPKRGPRRNTTGAYRLTRSPEGWRLDFLGPLGSVMARLRVDPQGAVWSEPGQDDIVARDAEGLMASRLGFALSPSTLFAWLRGAPAADRPSQPLSEGGFRQAGWDVVILGRDDQGFPSRIRAENTDLRLTVSVREEP